MNSITLENITNLKAEQLTQLLLMLLHLEHKKYNFPNCYISVPQNITTPDGGEDGRITTTDYKDSRWIVDVFCLIQAKATSMSRVQCKKEILNTKNDALKVQVKEVFDKNGTYILFTTDNYVEQNLQDRIDGFREAVKSVESEEYSNNVKIKIYDANFIKDWTNEYISAVSYVQLLCGIQRPLGLQIWDEFKSYKSNQSNFKTNPTLNSVIEQIRNNISKKNIRIEGVSGIGKSRLVCEALSPGDKDAYGNYDLVRKSISDSVIYFDLGVKNNASSILDFIKSLGTTHPATLVLDNCEPIFHQQFLIEAERTGGVINIISIDYEKWSNSDFLECDRIELKSEFYKSVVADILKEEYSEKLSDSAINYLIEFSEGNPKMAIKFVESALREQNLGTSFDNDLVKKLIFGRSEYKNGEFEVLRFLSAFKYFEYPSDEYYNINPQHYNTLLEHIEYFSLKLDIKKQIIREIILKFIEKGVLERRGHKIIIRPNPLSLKLSLLFWQALAPPEYEGFVTNLPTTLKNPVVEQLQQLGNNDTVKDLIVKFWGVDGNFSTEEILNSNMGSRLFRSIATVNPEATVKVLTKNYLNQPKEYLETKVEGRQNLVWALEKLCFRRETFIESAKVLMCFAVAEIETYYSNNATSYFTQLFRIYLAGTEVGYSPRIEVLKWALEKQDPDFNALVIKACERAFTPISNLHKMGGAENQGGLLPLEDYKPNSAIEINEYREKILELLSSFISHKNEFQFSAQRVIYSNISDLFEFNYDINNLKIIIDIIFENIVDRDNLLKSLYAQVSFIRIDEPQRQFINDYIERLKTNSIEERILYNVSEPKIIIRTIKDEDSYSNKGKRLAEKFAEDVIYEEIDIRPYFKNLLTGYQYNTFDFGKKLSELSIYNQDFIDDLISVVLTLENKPHNLSFLFGYISVLEPEKINEIFNIFISKKSSFAFNILRFIDISFENVLKLIDLVKNHNIQSNKLDIIKYDVVKLNPNDLIKYFGLIKNLENGHILILDAFSNVLWVSRNSQLEINESILNYIKSIVKEENLLININSTRTIDLYSWEQMMAFLIKKFQVEICKNIANQIVEYQKSLSLLSSGEPHIANIANLTLDIDFENCWNIYSKLILEKHTIEFWNIFDMSFISGVTAKHPFFCNKIRNKKLLSWLLINREIAPWVIRVAPLFDENGKDWFLFTEELINIFGKDKTFINELSSNLHSMTTWGSRVPFLKSRLKLVEQLKDHKIKEVQEWAISEVETYQKRIKIEEITDEEGFLGL
ncbi:hypothetical protein [Polaribacter staleyi]|uniref:hypothetical protein n=1 Tax=Polaribacter staleyi TaxID=2022337 RepID=UPI0031BB1820